MGRRKRGQLTPLELEQVWHWLGAEPGPMLLLRHAASHGDLGRCLHSQVAAAHPGPLCRAPRPADHTLANRACCAQGLGAGKHIAAGMAAEHMTHCVEPLHTPAATSRSRQGSPVARSCVWSLPCCLRPAGSCITQLEHGQAALQSVLCRSVHCQSGRAPAPSCCAHADGRLSSHPDVPDAS